MALLDCLKLQLLSLCAFDSFTHTAHFLRSQVVHVQEILWLKSPMFIEKYQLFWIEISLGLPPHLTPRCHIRTIEFIAIRTFFNVRP